MTGSLAEVRHWMATGTAVFLQTLEEVPDAAFAEPSMLPDWTVGHLVAHVHHNAEALRRLASWAATGIETPMYASPAQRAAEIEASSGIAPDELRRLVTDSAQRLGADLDALTPEAWSREVVTAQGRTVPASEIPWLRTREVVVHTVDLGTDTGFDAFPHDLVGALLTSVVQTRLARGEGPLLGPWLTGRTDTPADLPPWL